MKQTAKEKVYETLIELTQYSGTVTAEAVAERLSMSRQNASHYLTRLLEENMVRKIEGKPVFWDIDKPLATNATVPQVFEEIVGYNGSLQETIQQCIAAVKYPPNGLSILINGESGVGKSFIAQKIYEYAKEINVINKKAPFLILNCAEYADNPELLAATLFGYKKGAFTGAEKDSQGILASANSGYLFLDEIHRLSNENQEKLFLFMDSGKFRPLGENSVWHSAKVRLIFATTEKSEDYFLETFARRIQVNVTLPTYNHRPLFEKLALIQAFFLQEAKLLNKEIIISKEALALLLSHTYTGNVGKLKNIIKISCANVFSKNIENTLRISANEIEYQLDITTQGNSTLLVEDMYISPLEEAVFSTISQYKEKIQSLLEILIAGDIEKDISYIQSKVQELVHELSVEGVLSKSQYYAATMYQKLWEQIVVKKYGLIKSGPMGQITSFFYVQLFVSKLEFSNALRSLEKKYARSYYVARQFISELPNLLEKEKQLLQFVLTVILLDYVDETVKLKGLMLAHGDSMASSIQAVVNQLCGTYIFEALDMPIESNVSEIVELTRQFVNQQVNSDSLIVIVDMGSLNQIYTQIKNDLKGELLVINNLTTAIALDIGLKMSTNSPFHKIAEDAEEKYAISAQYYEGFSQKNNVIISCMSGLGISDKLARIFSMHLPEENIEVVTKEYRALRDLIDENDKAYFEKTKLVITTSNLPKSFSIPNINIYDIVDTTGKLFLETNLREELSSQELQKLIQELIRFFSLEGIADRLNFLNPSIVMNEVETVVSKYENYYQFVLDGKVKLNFYMHTALMMERLFMERTEKSEEPLYELNSMQEEFYYVSRSIFQPMEMKYNFKVNAYELSLLFELLQGFIKK